MYKLRLRMHSAALRALVPFNHLRPPPMRPSVETERHGDFIGLWLGSGRISIE